MAKCCLCLWCLSFLKRRVSSYFLHLKGKFRCSWSSSVATSLLVLFIQPCIFLPSLRTRRCVSIVLFCFRSPCTSQIFSTRCLEHPRAFRRNRILHSHRTCRDNEGRFIVGFDFATILSSPSCSYILFAIVLVQLVKLKF